MKRMTTLFAAGAAVLAFVALAAGCGSSSGASASGGSGNSSGAYGSGPSSSGGASKAAGGGTIAVAQSSLGSILVDGQRRTVYLFEKDTGTASTCYGACASIWPPVTTSGAPKAGNGVDAGKLGTTKRSDGTLEVTYNGHPLYTYTGDSQAGQTNGEGVNAFGAEWYAVSPAGQVVENGGS